MTEFLWAPTRRGEGWHVCEEAVSRDGNVKLSVEQLSSVCRWCVVSGGTVNGVRRVVTSEGRTASLSTARTAAEAEYAVVRRMIDAVMEST